MIKQLNAALLVSLVLTGCMSNKTSTMLNANQMLGLTDWKTTNITLDDNTDVLNKNLNYAGLARYDAITNRYEFFDISTGKSKGDEGVFFVTNDGKKRILVSETKKYHAIVNMEKLDKNVFIYSRQGHNLKDENANIHVKHIPYSNGFNLTVSKTIGLDHKTGDIVAVDKQNGTNLLASTLWQGKVALDEKGNDVSKYNANFLGLARYDDVTNRYEFFKKDGSPSGDYGYYSVINNNKQRVTVSLGKKYHAVLELTELNKNKFTYRRQGKDANGSQIWITVEHIPYKGSLSLNFSK